ncbi:MAG TPA: peptidoglycan DD-metalloendopeptidase family protein, partial [Stellaceae bacterium]
ASLVWAGGARAATESNPADQLHAIEQTEAQSRAERDTLAHTAQALATEIDGLRQQSVSVAEAMQRHEAALSMLEAQLKSLAADETRKAAELRREELSRGGLLMALVQLARNPPEALALASPDPVVAERGALLMGRAVPPLDRAAHRLNTDLKQLAALRLAIARAEEQHRLEQGSLNSQQLRLADVIGRKAALERQARIGTAMTEQKLAALAAEAVNLKDLIERLDAEKQKRETAAARVAMIEAAARIGAMPPPAVMVPVAAPSVAPAPAPAAHAPADPAKPPRLRSFLYAPGQYLIPASGSLVGRYDKPNEVGLTSKGLTYATRAAAQVVAPYDGRVLFAGPFRGYGQILIIEHDDGYHSLIAGLAKLTVTVGQWLVTGEPVGVMPDGEEKPRLYLELRHDGQPINPLPWLATSNEKVSG